jgi:hypothetical protein
MRNRNSRSHSLGSLTGKHEYKDYNSSINTTKTCIWNEFTLYNNYLSSTNMTHNPIIRKGTSTTPTRRERDIYVSDNHSTSPNPLYFTAIMKSLGYISNSTNPTDIQ